MNSIGSVSSSAIAIVLLFFPCEHLHTFDRFIVGFLLCWLARSLRLEWRERSIYRRARLRGTNLAPMYESSLPFGISIAHQRLRMTRSGQPGDVLELFKDFPQKTQVIRTRTFGVETILTLSHLDAKHVLSTGFSKWGKSQNFKESFRPLLGDGIFASDQRSLWSWHRSLARPHFVRERVADVEACQEHASRLVMWLQATDQPVEIQDGM